MADATAHAALVGPTDLPGDVSGWFQKKPLAIDAEQDAPIESFSGLVGQRLASLKEQGSLVSVSLPIYLEGTTDGRDPVAEAMETARQLLRNDDVTGLQGRDSFCVFLANADREVSEKVAVRLRHWLKAYQPVIGVAVLREDGETAAELVRAAQNHSF